MFWEGTPVFEFLSSPFGLVAVGLGVLAVAVLALCLWITTLDRRMRGMADGLEAERRKVAEMQMVIGRRSNAARSYGGRGRAAAPAPAPVAAPMTQAAPGAGVTGAPVAGAPAATQAAYAAQPAARGRATRPASAPGAGWTPSSIPMPASNEVDAWVGGAPAQQPIIMPDRKMSRKARREAERAFAARAAAELEARQARRAQEAASVQRAAAQPGARAGYAVPRAAGQAPRAGVQAGRPGAPAARAAAQPAGVPAQAQGFAPVQPAYGAVPQGARARHAR